MLLEVCVDHIEAVLVLNSVNSGRRLSGRKIAVDRLEVCGPLSVGGTTPSIGFIMEVARVTTIPFRVMLRPRTGGFEYTEAEIAVLYKDASAIRNYCEGCALFEGFVVGFTRGRHLDVSQLRDFVSHYPTQRFTLHRAVDLTTVPLGTLASEILSLPPQFDCVLTSGRSLNGILAGVPVAYALQRELTKVYSSVRLILGSGVNEETFDELLSLWTAAGGGLDEIAWLHGSFSKVVSGDTKGFGSVSIPCSKALEFILNKF